MDGLLADLFNTISRKIYNKDYKNITQAEKDRARVIWKNKNEFNKHFGDVESFFANLQPFENKTNEIIRLVAEFTKNNNDVFEEGYAICSHPANIDSKASEAGKRIWIKENLIIQPNEQHFPAKKSIYAKGTNGVPNVLVDDFPPYIQAWQDRGGIPIEMRTSDVNNIGSFLIPKLEQAKIEINEYNNMHTIKAESFNDFVNKVLTSVITLD